MILGMMRPRGIALVSAMFIVMVVYFLVSLTLADLRNDLGILQHAHRSTQAHYLAQAAVNRALDQLSGPHGSDWEQAYTWAQPDAGPSQMPPPDRRCVTREEPGGPACYAWIQTTHDPNLFYLCGAVEMGGLREFVRCSCWRRAKTSGAVFALETNGLLQPDSLYRYSEGKWETLPPAPRLHWNGSDPAVVLQGGHPVLAKTLLYPSGDPSGNVYAMGLNPVTLYRFDGRRNLWQIMPPLPGVDNILEVDFRGLAAGPDRLYVALRDGIYSLADPGRAATTYEADGSWTRGDESLGWQPIPSPDLAFFGPQGLRRLGGVATRTAGMTADGRDRLCVHIPIPLIGDTLARFDPVGSEWSYIPPPPSRGYEIQHGLVRVVDLPIGPQNLTVPASDAQGNVYVVSQPPRLSGRPATPYRFAPHDQVVDSVLQGEWTLLPPTRVTGEESALAPSQNMLAVDSDGHLVSKYTRGFLNGDNSLFSLSTLDRESEQPQELPTIPRQRAVPDDSAQGYHFENVSGPLELLPFLGAGGKPKGDGFDYVPIAWF